MDAKRRANYGIEGAGRIVLSRKEREVIQVVTPSGERLAIEVASIDRGRCQIAVIARREIRVVRDEIWSEEASGHE